MLKTSINMLYMLYFRAYLKSLWVGLINFCRYPHKDKDGKSILYRIFVVDSKGLSYSIHHCIYSKTINVLKTK